jgi:hypothetical protein
MDDRDDVDPIGQYPVEDVVRELQDPSAPNLFVDQRVQFRHLLNSIERFLNSGDELSPQFGLVLILIRGGIELSLGRWAQGSFPKSLEGPCPHGFPWDTGFRIAIHLLDPAIKLRLHLISEFRRVALIRESFRNVLNQPDAIFDRPGLHFIEDGLVVHKSPARKWMTPSVRTSQPPHFQDTPSAFRDPGKSRKEPTKPETRPASEPAGASDARARRRFPWETRPCGSPAPWRP